MAGPAGPTSLGKAWNADAVSEYSETDESHAAGARLWPPGRHTLKGMP
jgi:hypothetical protein